MTTTDTSNAVQEIYVGLLGRAADAEGLTYWTKELNEGKLTLEQLRANIVNEQPEYQTGLGQMERTELVTSLFQNLFARTPREQGIEYWVNGGGASVNADQLVLALIAGAAPADRDTLEYRVSAAQQYTSVVTNYNAAEARNAVEQEAPAFVANLNGRIYTAEQLTGYIHTDGFDELLLTHGLLATESLVFGSALDVDVADFGQANVDLIGIEPVNVEF